MPSPTEISVSQLARLVGQSNAPAIVDVRTDSDYAEDPRLVPGSLRRNAQDAATWAHDFSGSNVVVICQRGMKLSEFGLKEPTLQRLATIVRGADTARLDLAPKAAGLLAVSLGYSRMFKDDLAQLDAAMAVYDALYRWARDAGDETHNWPTPPKKA